MKPEQVPDSTAARPIAETDPAAIAAPIPAPIPDPSPAGKPGQSFLRTHLWQGLAALLVVVVAGGLLLRWWMGPQVSTESVLRRDFVQTVVASGHVEAPHRLDVGVQITGAVVRVPVTEGQAVKAGDLLVELEAAELSASSRQAEGAVVQAQAKLRQLQEVQGPVAAQTLGRAQATLASARAALARDQELFSRGFIGLAALEDARKTVQLADADVRAAQMQLDTTASSGSDRALALANVAGAQASAQAARARAGYTTIKAPVAGTLIARNVEVGDVVQPGKVLMTLSPEGATQLVVAIDEKNLALLALGQPALVSADAYPSQRFTATLAYINPGVNATTGAVEVKLDVAAPPAVLKQDMTVSVDIEVARRARALIVPLSAVHDAETTPWVLRLEGRHAMRRPVRLGLRSGGLAEVLGGLSEGDAVLSTSAPVKAGARVRATPMNATVAAPAASAPK
ncbi:HlyD family secretion protein [Actimicrobium sp. GrIS 1.19]|uniref:efflux RND transporter periplasmic adaptor subunit n=1 Tax=Actimicrobium sp. GrIS 1.19 TaxID=3071708 RepID=UPI002DFDF07C|nr:HlyD family secretion protein [Actimicrobium sp. GrIS 1.19]